MKLNDNFKISIESLKATMVGATKRIEKSAQYEQSFDPQDISRTMDDYFSTQQNTDPDAADFAVDSRKQQKAVSGQQRSAIQSFLSQLGKSYHEQVPINEIMETLENNGVVLLQEDGGRWSGMISPCGECGTTKGGEMIEFDLAVRVNDEFYASSTRLIMTLCTMPSGRIEFVGYLT